MTAKQRFLAQAVEKEKKHPKTAPKIVSFSLAMVFFGLSIIFIGIAHGSNNGTVTSSWVKTIMMIAAIITVQGSVVCSALGVTSSKYVLHVISSVSLALSLLIDVSLGIYYFVWVI